MSDTVDKWLSLGATSDWISPLTAMIQDWLNGPPHDFYIDWNAGWSVNEIKKLLKRNHVRVWGAGLVDGMIVFSVRQVQASRVQSLLEQKGVPILYGGVPDTGQPLHSSTVIL
jgi:hypothetical protein